MKISDMSYSQLAISCLELAEQAQNQRFFEDSAQQFCENFFTAYEESIVLSRIFIVRQFGSLPNDIADFTSGLAKQVNVEDQLETRSPILSLAGTKGRERAWSDRKTSGGHKGIPLVSSQFVSAVPMLMGVFMQTFGNLDWLDLKDYDEMNKITGKSSGTFYVKDAHVDVDNQNRKIIAAQDFVEAENVRSVLGIAGGLVDGSVLVMLNFTREDLDKKYLNALSPAMASLRAGAIKQCDRNEVFRNA